MGGGEEGRGGGKVCETDWEEKALLPHFQARFYLPDPPQTRGSFILSAENNHANIGAQIKGKRDLKKRERGPKRKRRGDQKGERTQKGDRGPPSPPPKKKRKRWGERTQKMGELKRFYRRERNNRPQCRRSECAHRLHTAYEDKISCSHYGIYYLVCPLENGVSIVFWKLLWS